MRSVLPLCPLPFVLLLLLLLLADGGLPAAEVAPFTCNATARVSCQALLGYVPHNATTYAAVKSLFQVRSLRSLLGANGLSLSTPSSAAVPAGSTVRVRFPCSCSHGTGVSARNTPVYKVKAGDGLDAIARNVFNGFVTYQEIQTANNISDPNKIEVGQKLWIPLPCSCDPVGGASVVHYAHVVTAGSSVDEIAAEFGTDKDVLLRLNGISDPTKLEAGQALIASSFAKCDYNRVKEITHYVLKTGFFIGIALAVVLFASFGNIAELFTKDAGVLQIVRTGVLFVSASQPINALAFIFDGLHYGVSDFSYSARSMMMVGALSSLFLLYAPSIFGLAGVWSGLTLFMSLRMSAGFLRLYWKTGPWWFLQQEIPKSEPQYDSVTMVPVEVGEVEYANAFTDD